MNFTSKLLQNLIEEKFINLLEYNIAGADLADMQSISKCNKRFICCVYSVCKWLV